MLRTADTRTIRAFRHLLVATCATALIAAACGGDDDDDDGGDPTTTTDATGVTVDADDDGPPEASVTGSAMDLLRGEPQFSSFRAAVEGTRYEEQLECADDEEALTRGWTIVLAPVDPVIDELASGGPAFDAENGFGDANDAFRDAAGVPDGTEVDFDLDGGIGSMTWTVGPGDDATEDDTTEDDTSEDDGASAGPNGTQHVLFAVVEGRAALPADTDTPALPSVATCGATSTLQFLVLGATVAEPDDASAEFPAIIVEED